VRMLGRRFPTEFAFTLRLPRESRCVQLPGLLSCVCADDERRMLIAVQAQARCAKQLC